MNLFKIMFNKTKQSHVQELLSAYLDNQLADGERQRVLSHLQVCPACQQEFESLRWTRSLLRQTPMVALPRSFVVRQADVESRPAPAQRRALWVTQWATALVALLFVVALLGDVFTAGMSQPAHAPASARMVASEQTDELQVTVVVVESTMPAEKVVQAERAGGQDVTPPGVVEPTAEPATLLAATTVEANQTVVVEMEKEVLRVAPAPQATPVPQCTATPPMSKYAATDAADQITPTILPPDATVGPEAATGMSYGEADAPPLSPPSRLPWRIAQVVLGLTLLGLVAAVMWLRQK